MIWGFKYKYYELNTTIPRLLLFDCRGYRVTVIGSLTPKVRIVLVEFYLHNTTTKRKKQQKRRNSRLKNSILSSDTSRWKANENGCKPKCRKGNASKLENAPSYYRVMHKRRWHRQRNHPFYNIFVNYI